MQCHKGQGQRGQEERLGRSWLGYWRLAKAGRWRMSGAREAGYCVLKRRYVVLDTAEG